MRPKAEMDFRLLTILVLALTALLAAGCQSGGGQELLERENRLLEDRVYALEDELDKHCDLLDTYERENEQLRQQLGERPASRRAPSQDQLRPPDIELGEPTSGLPPRSRDVILASGESPLGDAPPLDADARVERITLNRLSASSAGEARLTVIVEPREADGQVVAAAADVSIALLDPALPGEQARLARWDFTAAEAARRFRWTALGPTMHFELDWPESAPTGRALQLYVRYTTRDGRRLLADAPVRVPLSSAAAEGPTARRPQWSPYR
jgi:hypothetical protein